VRRAALRAAADDDDLLAGFGAVGGRVVERRVGVESLVHAQQPEVAEVLHEGRREGLALVVELPRAADVGRGQEMVRPDRGAEDGADGNLVLRPAERVSAGGRRTGVERGIAGGLKDDGPGRLRHGCHNGKGGNVIETAIRHGGRHLPVHIMAYVRALACVHREVGLEPRRDEW
jgi:hypothetical protein